MSRNKSDWHFPADLFALLFSPLLVVVIALMSMTLPGLNQIKNTNLVNLFWIGFGLGCLGIAILFFARLPLYRQRQFFKFGPKVLPPLHRKLYWSAYVIVLTAVLLLGIIWLRVK